MALSSERIEEAKNQVLKGEASPIVYFMELHRMDEGILASYVGKWVWQVKRHFKPSVFKTLNEKVLQKYADAFGINVADLKNFKID